MAEDSCFPALQKHIGVTCKKDAFVDTSATLRNLALSALDKDSTKVSLSILESLGASIKATK